MNNRLSRVIARGIAWVCAVLVAAGVCAPALAGETYYVRASGSNSNDGLSPATAFASVQHAVNQCDGPGHTVVVGPGVYDEAVEIGVGAGAAAQSGAADDLNRITGDVSGAATGEPSGAVVLRGSDLLATGIRIEGRSHWSIDSITLRGQDDHGIYWNSASGIIVSACTFEEHPGFALYGETGGNNSLLSNVVVRTATTGHGLTVWNHSSGTLRIAGNRLVMSGLDYLSTPFRDGAVPKKFKRSKLGKKRVKNAPVANGIVACVAGGVPTGTRVIVENNVVSDAYIGVYAICPARRASVQVSNNTVTGCMFPIYSECGRGVVTIADCIISRCYYGIVGYQTRGVGTIRRCLQHEVSVIKPPKKAVLFTELEPVSGDPALAAPADGDFAPSTGSPAVDDACGVCATITDLDGRIRPLDGDSDGTAEPDIGAIELGNARLRIVEWNESPSRGFEQVNGQDE